MVDPNDPGTQYKFAPLLGWRGPRGQLLRIGIWVLIAAIAVVQPLAAFAQSPRSLRIPPVVLPAPLADTELDGDGLDLQTATVRRIIVDTDPGVDDALALVWLLAQQQYPVEVVGIVTVAGNTEVAAATNNVLLLLNRLGRTDIPVVQGAAAPLVQTRSRTGQLIHGPDGLWGVGFYNPQDPSNVVPDATNFYCGAVTPGTLVLALGPLTNIAGAIESCPAQWAGVELVSLGGAKYGGNQTPTTEYNYWQDPEAAAFVAQNAATWMNPNSYTLTIVPFDAFSQFTLKASDLKRLQAIRNPALQQILQAVQFYYGSLSDDGSGSPVPVAIPDVAAAIYALDSRLGKEAPALVKVLSGDGIPEFVRGQSIVALTLFERISIIADDAELSTFADRALFDPTFDFGAALFAILSREPDNAKFVTSLRPAQMSATFFTGLRSARVGRGNSAADEDPEIAGQASPSTPGNALYMPMIR